MQINLLSFLLLGSFAASRVSAVRQEWREIQCNTKHLSSMVPNRLLLLLLLLLLSFFLSFFLCVILESLAKSYGGSSSLLINFSYLSLSPSARFLFLFSFPRLSTVGVCLFFSPSLSVSIPGGLQI